MLPSNTVNLAKMVRDAGGSAQHIIYPETGHIEILIALAKPFRGRAPVLSDAAAFIDGERLPTVVVR